MPLQADEETTRKYNALSQAISRTNDPEEKSYFKRLRNKLLGKS